MVRELFVFSQFNGSNVSYCDQHCPYCYGKECRNFKHYWNGDVDGWEKAFERLNRDIYFVMSYGEAMRSHGFYECVDMIGRHPNWRLCIITNLSSNPERLLASRLAKEKRLFITACWHPLGVNDRVQGWETFKKHVLMLKKAEVPFNVSYVWYKPQIKWFPEYFEWLDSHDVRVVVRRFIKHVGGFKLPVIHKQIGGKNVLEDYSEAERGYLFASTCAKVTKYGLNLVQPKGKMCSAGKDMILVKYDGDVAFCADCYGYKYYLGNIFEPKFKLRSNLTRCASSTCGGDYGMLHIRDSEFEQVPSHLEDDNFLMIVEDIKQGSPIPYHNRAKMLKWLELIKEESKNK